MGHFHGMVEASGGQSVWNSTVPMVQADRRRNNNTFRRDDDVFIASCVRWDTSFEVVDIPLSWEGPTWLEFDRNGTEHTACKFRDDVIKWKHFPRYWPFVRGIHRSPVNSPHKGQWRGALMFSLIFAWINDCKQSWGWWFEKPLRSWWRHCNVWRLPA